MDFPFNDAITLREILTYDFIVAHDLSLGERTAIHQLIGQRIDPSNTIKWKVLKMKKEIDELKWECPDCRYDSKREIETASFSTGNWNAFKNKQ